MLRFLRSRRKTPKPAPQWPLNSIGGISEYLQERLLRMQHLTRTRRGASVSELAVIDEEIDRICQGMAEDIEKFQVSERLRRMMRITLEELCEQRDKARQLRQPVTRPDRPATS